MYNSNLDNSFLLEIDKVVFKELFPSNWFLHYEKLNIVLLFI